MASRFVRFAPSFGSENDNQVDNSGGAQDKSVPRPSFGSALTGDRRVSNATSGEGGDWSRRASNCSDTGGPGASSSHRASSLGALVDSHKVNTAIAANDGPSLATALAQSIRHHARMVDGEQPVRQGGVLRSRPAYDPYQDDDHVSLAPGVELNYEKEAQPSAREERSSMAPALRDYVANAGVEESNDGGEGDAVAMSIERTVEQQQERLERLQDESFGGRLRTNISNWFGISDPTRPDVQRARSVRFAERGDAAAVAAAIAAGEALPGAAFGVAGRAPIFIAPPAASFRTATRHPSHIPHSEFDNVESRLNAPRRMLAARKRHRRNDSFLRLMVAILCFGMSLTFAIIWGEGRFGLAVTTMAYERKVAGRYDVGDSDDRGASSGEEEVFYPDWWESEKGIPDMEARDIKFSQTLEYNAAEVSAPRAPARIETPFFWFVPRSGGNAIRTIMARCLRLAEASEAGAGDEASFLRIEEQEDRRFVNVDMSTSKGINHASDLKIASSGVPDVIISGDIHGVLEVFNNRNRARIFAVLRHPLDRAIAKYYADLGSDLEVAGMTLPQYVKSGGHRVENNYLTRYLSGRYGGRLEVRHLDVAREFLRRKVVVGLSSDIPATANLFSHVFGWNETAALLGLENVDLCYNSIYSALKDKPPPSVEEGSDGWKLLVAQNWFDLKLFEYAEHLFRVQVDQLKLKGRLSSEAVE